MLWLARFMINLCSIVWVPLDHWGGEVPRVWLDGAVAWEQHFLGSDGEHEYRHDCESLSDSDGLSFSTDGDGCCEESYLTNRDSQI